MKPLRGWHRGGIRPQATPVCKIAVAPQPITAPTRSTARMALHGPRRVVGAALVACAVFNMFFFAAAPSEIRGAAAAPPSPYAAFRISASLGAFALACQLCGRLWVRRLSARAAPRTPRPSGLLALSLGGCDCWGCPGLAVDRITAPDLRRLIGSRGAADRGRLRGGDLRAIGARIAA